MPYILDKDVVYFGRTRFWAEGGRLHWEDTDTGDYNSMSVRDCLTRLKGLSEMVGNSRTGKGYHRPDEVKEHQRYINEMIKLCEKAKEQGMPEDASARRDLVRRRKKLFTVPSGLAAKTF